MPPIIVKGGEQIPNNTYGFEIEFCTHDNSVFTFTHVDTAVIYVISAEGQVIAEWNIETDSGNVLELVSPPLRFPDIATAVSYKKRLSDLLVDSVAQPCTYLEWMTNKAAPVMQWILHYYGNTVRVQPQYKTAVQVHPQINVENVDDGINIQAARKRLEINGGNWEAYVGATILARSEKDWFSGYSSQVNMPMTVEGYLLYSTTKKLLKSQKRFEVMVNRPEELSLYSTSRLEKNMNTWFWRNVTFTAFVMYAYRTWGPDVLPFIRYLVPEIHQPFLNRMTNLPVTGQDLVVDVQTFTEVTTMMEHLASVNAVVPGDQQLKLLAVLYISVCKMLTGALGALSERNQLAFQELAWRRGSTEVMVPQTENDELMAARRWLEYHSSMKDLTGLWFKGALMDVMAKEGIFTPIFNNSTIPARFISINAGWEGILGTYVSLMRSARWNTGRIYTDDLQDLQFKVLAEHIRTVEDNFNRTVAGWQAPPPFTLPRRDERKFLHYGELPFSTWEGRYDTMVASIPGHDGVGYTYLVEHRFN